MRIRSLIFLLPLLLISDYAIPCSCLEISVEDAAKGSVIVFKGKVIGIEFTSIEAFIDSSVIHPNEHIITRILVENVYKGSTQKKLVTVYTPRGGHACGVNFELGATYIIYGSPIADNLPGIVTAVGGEDIFWTSQCRRTALYDAAEAKALRELK